MPRKLAKDPNLIERTIYFYDLQFLRADDTPLPNWQSIFHYAHALRGVNRCQSRGNREVCIWNGAILTAEGIIKGELAALREDAVGRISHAANDTRRDVAFNPGEQMSESTHYALLYGNGKQLPRLAIEYNHFGPRLTDFIRLLEFHARHAGIPLDRIEPALVVRPDNLTHIYEHVGRLARLRLRIHTEALARVREYGGQLISGLDAADDFGSTDYIEIIRKFNIRNQSQTLKERVRNLVRLFKEDSNRLSDFAVLEVRAEDGGTVGSVMSDFDFKDAEVKKVVGVARLATHRRVVDGDAMMAHVVLAAQEFASDGSTR